MCLESMAITLFTPKLGAVSKAKFIESNYAKSYINIKTRSLLVIHLTSVFIEIIKLDGVELLF